MTQERKDTIEKQTERVLDFARELTCAINNFLTADLIGKGEGQPTPTLYTSPLGHIEENLNQTVIALQDALKAFNEIKSRIR